MTQEWSAVPGSEEGGVAGILPGFIQQVRFAEP